MYLYSRREHIIINLFITSLSTLRISSQSINKFLSSSSLLPTYHRNSGISSFRFEYHRVVQPPTGSDSSLWVDG